MLNWLRKWGSKEGKEEKMDKAIRGIQKAIKHCRTAKTFCRDQIVLVEDELRHATNADDRARIREVIEGYRAQFEQELRAELILHDEISSILNCQRTKRLLRELKRSDSAKKTYY